MRKILLAGALLTAMIPFGQAAYANAILMQAAEFEPCKAAIIAQYSTKPVADKYTNSLTSTQVLQIDPGNMGRGAVFRDIAFGGHKYIHITFQTRTIKDGVGQWDIESVFLSCVLNDDNTIIGLERSQ